MPNIYNCEKNQAPKKKIPPPPHKPNKKEKFSFKTCKKNTINSLHEVEHFLRDFKHISKYLKLYKLLK